MRYIAIASPHQSCNVVARAYRSAELCRCVSCAAELAWHEVGVLRHAATSQLQTISYRACNSLSMPRKPPKSGSSMLCSRSKCLCSLVGSAMHDSWSHELNPEAASTPMSAAATPHVAHSYQSRTYFVCCDARVAYTGFPAIVPSALQHCRACRPSLPRPGLYPSAFVAQIIIVCHMKMP